jgi:membrane associated rhomboid family serine protease
MLGGIGPAAVVIMVVTIIVSLVGLKSPHVIEKTVLRPYWVTRRGEWERLITSGFVHGSGGHLFFNMLSFFFFAFPLERVIGSARFIILYFAGLVLSDLGTWYKHRNNPDYASLGASGAVLAVMFAYIVYFPSSSLYLFFVPVPIPAPLFAVGYLAYSWYQSRQNVGRINHDAHIGGAITGLLFVAVFDRGAYRELFDVINRLIS